VTRLTIACLLAAAVCGAVPAGASAEPRLVVSGAGFGHGVGMSQYGAYGYALHGFGYRAILAHYYSGTALGTAVPNRVVRTILQANARISSFTGASRVGTRPVSPRYIYLVVRVGNVLELRTSRGTPLLRSAGPLVVSGALPLTLRFRALNGVYNGRYHGALEFRPGRLGGVNAINAALLDDYTAGVVAAEMPASWALEALKAQAVAARTYAITTNAGGIGWEQWPDTRSQVYRGVAGESPRATTAVRATARQVVTFAGRPVTTFFFSTSGGQTENVEDSFLGSPARPWLRSVSDPYDTASRLHRWTLSFSLSVAEARLSGYVRGTLQAINVIRTGLSPRVISAQVVGSAGTTTISGPTLKYRLALYDTWATFSVVG
jgi:stage II sporulation protein D